MVKRLDAGKTTMTSEEAFGNHMNIVAEFRLLISYVLSFLFLSKLTAYVNELCFKF